MVKMKFIGIIAIALYASFTGQSALALVAGNQSTLAESVVLEERYGRKVDLGLYESLTGLPKLSGEPLTREQYERYRAAYQNKIVNDSPAVSFNSQGCGLSVRTDKAVHCYPTDDACFGLNRQYVNYLGAVPALNLLIFESYETTAEFTLGSAFWIDTKRDAHYLIEVDADAAAYPPVISPGYRYMAVYHQDVLIDNPLLRLFKIVPDGDSFTYQAFASLSISGQVIDEVIWIDDGRFALRLENTNGADYQAESEEQLEALRHSNMTYLSVTLP